MKPSELAEKVLANRGPRCGLGYLIPEETRIAVRKSNLPTIKEIAEHFDISLSAAYKLRRKPLFMRAK